MIKKDSNRINIGIVGCGPIAQFAHFESCQKGRNVNLYAICDVADDLRNRMNEIWKPERSYKSYDDMLGDSKVDAVIVAVSDAFHVPLSIKALAAGKHVLMEKPMTHSIEEAMSLVSASENYSLHVQIGHMKRFDQGLEFAKEFSLNEMGKMISLKAWYCDSIYRYTITDNVQPLPVQSTVALKPSVNDKEDKKKYYMMAHGSHLIDTAIHFAGKIKSIHALFHTANNIYSWSCLVHFTSGAIGNFDLTIPVIMDWNEGIQIYGTEGSILAKTYNPWYYKSSDVQCFSKKSSTYHQPIGADGFSYRRQLESFADVVMGRSKQTGTTVLDGLHITRVMIAIKKSIDENRQVEINEIIEGEL